MPLLESRGSLSAFGYGLNSEAGFGSLGNIEPITQYGGVSGIAAVYTAQSYDPVTTTWYDLSGNKRHTSSVQNAAGINKGTTYSNQNGVNKSFPTLWANANAGIRFPDSLDLNGSYTLFHVARRYGNTTGGNAELRGRIFDGLGDNWLSGFWGGYSGLAFHNGWLTQLNTDTHINNWILSSDRLNNYRSNGVDRTTNAPTPGTVATSTLLTLHAGNYTQVGAPTETSTWVCSEVVFYQTELKNTQVAAVESALKTKYGFTY